MTTRRRLRSSEVYDALSIFRVMLLETEVYGGAGSGDGCAEPDCRVWAGMRCPSEQLCAVSAADRGADVQFAPEGFAPRWSLPSPFHGEEAKLPKGCGAFRTADQTISSRC
jgi:hypothetical protein